MVAATRPNPLRAELLTAVEQCRVRRLRTRRQWACEEVVIPEGRFQGYRFNCERQPYAGLLLDAIDSGLWTRFGFTGPTQSGKSLLLILNLLWHLFEVGESCVFGIPDMRMASDKWRLDILPVLKRTRYAALIPTSGIGSRGGSFGEIQFLNGAMLKFMSPGGSDKSRSGFSARVLLVTEADGPEMDQAASTSREGDPISQMQGRLLGYDVTEQIIYMESTVSTNEGRIWEEYVNGTRSTIMLGCPHCGGRVSPEREHLLGWQDAETEKQAYAAAAFYCPACGEQWSETDRRTANLAGRLIHRGQQITPEGRITGELPETFTLGFRWSAVHNLFPTAGTFGVKEFKAAAKGDDNAERIMCQQIWCVPHESNIDDVTPLKPEIVKGRFGTTPQGIVPVETDCITAALDVHKRFGAWGVIAWRKDGTGHVLDYGTLEIPSDDVGEERAILLALREFRERVMQGWIVEGSGQPRVPDQAWIDAGYMTPVVYRFIREAKDMRFRPAVGRGQNQQARQLVYNRPKKTGAIVKFIGEEYHLSLLPKDRVFLVETNSDYWKAWLHQRLRTELGRPGALSFYASLDRNQHNTLAKQLTAEREVIEFVEGRGDRRKWIRESRSNHYLDTLYMACAAAHLCKVRLATEPAPPPRPFAPPKKTTLRMPDGRPFLVTERK